MKNREVHACSLHYKNIGPTFCYNAQQWLDLKTTENVVAKNLWSLCGVFNLKML